MDYVQPAVLIAGGLGLLAIGGDTLLKGAVGLARRLHLTPAIIGLTVVAAGREPARRRSG